MPWLRVADTHHRSHLADAAPLRGAIGCIDADALSLRPIAGGQDAVNIFGPFEACACVAVVGSTLSSPHITHTLSPFISGRLQPPAVLLPGQLGD